MKKHAIPKKSWTELSLHYCSYFGRCPQTWTVIRSSMDSDYVCSCHFCSPQASLAGGGMRFSNLLPHLGSGMLMEPSHDYSERIFAPRCSSGCPGFTNHFLQECGISHTLMIGWYATQWVEEHCDSHENFLRRVIRRTLLTVTRLSLWIWRQPYLGFDHNGIGQAPNPLGGASNGRCCDSRIVWEV